MIVKRRRTYRSTLRAAQAAATRERILEAGRTALAERGYAGTSMDEVAEAAGVSLPTVYAVIGNKKQLLRAVLANVGEREDLGASVHEILSSRDPHRQLNLVAHLARRLWGAGGDLVRILMRSRWSDSELAAMYGALEDERRLGEAPLIAMMSQRGQLRPDLPPEDALDLLLMLSGPAVHEILVQDCGWTAERYEAWVSKALVQSLLR
jgi:AcrR family transcriptional regulator